jgi:hypothetical protein
MKKYQLNEKLSDEALNHVLRLGAASSRFFFRKDEESCYKLDYHIDYMLENGISEINLYLAKRETNAPFFFCKHFGEVGEKSEGGCGKLCNGYDPRNGNSGVCKHYGYTYEQTDRCFTLKLSDELVFQNEC